MRVALRATARLLDELVRGDDRSGEREQHADELQHSASSQAFPPVGHIALVQTIVRTSSREYPVERCSAASLIFPANRPLVPRKRSKANIAFGHAARSSRVERGLAQEAFALRICMDRGYYGAVERGEFNVSLDTIVKIAAGLEISAAALLRRAGL